MKLNLHTHSTFSDGICTPTELVDKQVAEGIEVMSLTDHDSVNGIDEAMERGRERGIKVLSGIELSCYGTFEIHMLGYNIDYKNPAFVEKLDVIRNMRRARVLKTIQCLADNGVVLDTSNLNFDDCNLGRLHIAKQMVKQGYSVSVNEAFNHYLGTDKPAHISGMRARPFEVVQLICQFGGVAVLAHPITIPKNNLELLVARLCDYGLIGIESYYATNNETDTKTFLGLAKKYNLINTCGTDYHDENGYISPSYTNSAVDARSLRRLGIIK
ncbi:MAG: PHP domain-containing protein [Clostridia bacterium]